MPLRIRLRPTPLTTTHTRNQLIKGTWNVVTTTTVPVVFIIIMGSKPGRVTITKTRLSGILLTGTPSWAAILNLSDSNLNVKKISTCRQLKESSSAHKNKNAGENRYLSLTKIKRNFDGLRICRRDMLVGQEVAVSSSMRRRTTRGPGRPMTHRLWLGRKGRITRAGPSQRPYAPPAHVSSRL